MPKDNLWTFSPSDYSIYTSVLGTAMPSTLPTSGTSNPGTGWYDCGFLSDAGVTEAHNYNENKVYDMAGSLLRIVRNQEERPWTFECTQYDAIVAGLQYPGTSVTTTGGTAEVQTITISGTPTGGTFTPALSGFPSVPAQTYNVATAALQTALIAAWDLAVTVSGTAGTSYVVTFPVAEGNITQMTVSSALTGGSSPTASVTTTTPGVTGVNSRGVGSGIASNRRQFCIDLLDGATAKRVLIANGEAVWTGSVPYANSGISIAQFTLQPYKDANGLYYTVLDNAQGQGLTFA
jgi:hypothetical protein